MTISHHAQHPLLPEGMNPGDWRKSIERQLEEMLDRQFELVTLLDLLDADEGVDPDLEPSLGAPEIGTSTTEVWSQAEQDWVLHSGTQEDWAKGSSADFEQNAEDEGEAVNEDGGDVQDEPHDEADEGNREYSLCYGICGGTLDEDDAPCFHGEYRGRLDVSEGRALVHRALTLAGVKRPDPDELVIIKPGVAMRLFRFSQLSR